MYKNELRAIFSEPGSYNDHAEARYENHKSFGDQQKAYAVSLEFIHKTVKQMFTLYNKAELHTQ